ncbi:hypothetical protein EES43_28985 [Streptomyces sp. ADI96-02]|nr:hypothetical protein EES43_28985 [Streptomyces sp. ADI96-02]
MTVPSGLVDFTGRSAASYPVTVSSRSPVRSDRVLPLARSDTVTVSTPSAPVTLFVRRPTPSASRSTVLSVEVTAVPGSPPFADASPRAVVFATSPASSPVWYSNSSVETVPSSPSAFFAAFVTVFAIAFPSPVKVFSTTCLAPVSVSFVSVRTGIEFAPYSVVVSTPSWTCEVCRPITSNPVDTSVSFVRDGSDGSTVLTFTREGIW